jgi:hypothetical protein
MVKTKKKKLPKLQKAKTQKHKTENKIKTQKKNGEPSRSSVLRAERSKKSILIGRSDKIKGKVLHKWIDFHNLDAADAFQKLFGFHPNVNLFDATKYTIMLNKKTARDWLERAGAQQQCNNVIGAFVDGTICYICGLPIRSGNEECEHILPVFKAATHLHLYRSEHKGTTDPHLKYELLLEYRWAHRCCNQVKKDLDFITLDNNDTFKVDIELAKTMLREIIKKMKSGQDICSDKALQAEFANLRKRSGENGGGIDINSVKDINKWIDERLDILQEAGPAGWAEKTLAERVPILESALKISLSVTETGKRKHSETPDAPRIPGPLKLIVEHLNGKDRKTRQKYKQLSILASLAKVIAAADMDEISTVWRRQEGLPDYSKDSDEKTVTKEDVDEDMLVMFKDLAFDWNSGFKDIDAFYTDFLDWPVSKLKYRMTDSPVIKNQLVSAGKFSLDKKNKENPFFKEFFDDTMLILQYKGFDANDSMAIAGLSYSILILMTYYSNMKRASRQFLSTVLPRKKEICDIEINAFLKKFSDMLIKKCLELNTYFVDTQTKLTILQLLNDMIKRTNSVYKYKTASLSEIFGVPLETEENIEDILLEISGIKTLSAFQNVST